MQSSKATRSSSTHGLGQLQRPWILAAVILLVFFISCPLQVVLSQLADMIQNDFAKLRGYGKAGRWIGNQTVSDSGLTVVLLNYKRPQNIRRVVRSYLAMPKSLVHGIVLFNNAIHDDLSELYDPRKGGDARVTVIGASENVGIGNNRFFAASLARSRAVLSQDDDLILSQAGVEELLGRWRQEPDRVHGTFCRGPTEIPGSKTPVPEPDLSLSHAENDARTHYGYNWDEHRLTGDQVARQGQRVQALAEQAAGASEVIVGGSAWRAPAAPLRAPGMSDKEHASSACPILITRIVVFDRERAYQYFRWVLELQDTIPKQKPFGHGEDLLLSLLSVRETGGKLNRVWRGVAEDEVKELPEMGVGVSAVNGDHIEFRSMFMRLACERLGLPCWDWVRPFA